MLTGNLATRPFYNERLVRVVLIVALVSVAAWTAVNLISLYSLSRRGTMFGEVIGTETAKAATARSEAQALRATLDGAEVASMSRAAAEANQLIAHRAFSWTSLFDRFELTLPPDVRLVHVQPQVDQEGRLLVAMTVISKSVEDLDDFIARLEASGSFTGVLSRQDEALDDDTIQSSLQGFYHEPANAAPVTSQPTQAPSPRPEAKR
jgi:hypothetical protein